MNKGFQPIYDKNSKILILGSFPSKVSREFGFYYANKSNRFWRTLAKIYNEQIDESVEDKIKFLHRHNIALWDVVTESDITSSADSELEKSNNKQANLDVILQQSKINKIICNGKTAYNLLTKNYKTDIPIKYSTSSANPRFTFEEWEKELLSD